jgi:hypothetical protein
MSKKKHPLEKSIKLSEAYTICYQKYTSPSSVGNIIRGYYHSDYTTMVKKYENFFFSKKIGNQKPRFKSKVQPLIQLIVSKIELNTKEKERLTYLLDRQYFRDCISKKTSCKKVNDILDFVSFVAIFEWVKIEYKDFLKKTNRSHLSRTKLKNQMKKLDKEFIPEIKILATNKQYTSVEKFRNQVEKLPQKFKKKLIKLNSNYYRYIDTIKYSILYAEAHNFSKTK